MSYERYLKDFSVNPWFIGLLKEWWLHFSDILENVIKAGNIPVVIAISRKMPRFLEWFINEGHEYDEAFKSKFDVLKNIQITTELAIPFLYVQSDFSNIEFVIIDDSVIRGSTLRKVAENLFILSGKKCRFSSILVNEDLLPPSYLYLYDWMNIRHESEESIISLTDQVSTIVERHSLPIDMEFPILNMRNADFLEVLKRSNDVYPKNVYHVGSNPDRFTIDLLNFNGFGGASEFVKFRFFKNDDGFSIEALSPHVLSETQLLESLFSPINNYSYQNIWDCTTSEIRSLLHSPYNVPIFNSSPSLYHEFLRSLCVWMNYLFSLASFTTNIPCLFLQSEWSQLHLSKRDLKYILGDVLADEIHPLLEDILISLRSMKSYRDMPLQVPDSYAPSTFVSEFASVKFENALTADSLEDVLCSVFGYMHFSNPKFRNPYLSRERLFFGETIESLFRLMKYRSDQDWNLFTLGAWIDLNIDRGYVIPRFDSVKSEDGNFYWRRFFHSGARKFYKP